MDIREKDNKLYYICHNKQGEKFEVEEINLIGITIYYITMNNFRKWKRQSEFIFLARCQV